MTDTPGFRAALGLIAVLGSLIAFGGLFFIEIPARNENALMFAMGVIFGWGSAVFASEYGSSSTARKVTEGAIRQMENLGAAPPPENVQTAAQDTADAAQKKADAIRGRQ